MTLRTRVIPCLLLQKGALVKTVRFEKPTYVGDPLNAVRIYNEKEVDELMVLDITATREARAPDLKLVQEIASECFMPIGYGGGVRALDDFGRLFHLGVEKVVVNTLTLDAPSIVEQAAARFGSQSIVGSIDVKRHWWHGQRVFRHSRSRGTSLDPVDHARRLEQLGVGEILLTSVDRDGTMQGYDVELLRAVSSIVSVPVIACGGAGTVSHFGVAVRQGGAAAVAAGSMVVFHGRNRAVLINFPSQAELRQVLD